MESHPAAHAPARPGLPGTVELLTRALAQFKVRWSRLAALIVLMYLAMGVLAAAVAAVIAALLAGTAVAGGEGGMSVLVIGGIVVLAAVAAMTAVGAVQSVAMIDAVLEERPRPLMRLVRDGFGRLKPAFWLVALVGFFNGAFFLFGIPGIVVGVFTAFSIWAFVDGKGKGMEAVYASHAMVRGRWWPVFGRGLLAIAMIMAARVLLFALLAMLLGALDQSMTAALVQAAIDLGFSLFIVTPFAILFVGEVYKELRRHPSPMTKDDKARVKNWYLGASIAGWVLFLAVPTYAVVTILGSLN